MVATVWVSCTATNWKHVPISGIDAISSAAEVIVTYEHNRSNGIGHRIVVVESDEAAELSAFWDEGTTGDDIGLTSTTRIELNSLLGERRILLVVP